MDWIERLCKIAYYMLGEKQTIIQHDYHLSPLVLLVSLEPLYCILSDGPSTVTECTSDQHLGSLE